MQKSLDLPAIDLVRSIDPRCVLPSVIDKSERLLFRFVSGQYPFVLFEIDGLYVLDFPISLRFQPHLFCSILSGALADLSIVISEHRTPVTKSYWLSLKQDLLERIAYNNPEWTFGDSKQYIFVKGKSSAHSTLKRCLSRIDCFSRATLDAHRTLKQVDKHWKMINDEVKTCTLRERVEKGEGGQILIQQKRSVQTVKPKVMKEAKMRVIYTPMGGDPKWRR